MKFSRKLVGVAALLLTLLATSFGVFNVLGTSAAPSPTARANAVPTSTPASPDAAAITDLIVRSYAVRTHALKTFDTSQLATAFMDDPSVSLSGDKADFVNKVRSRYGNAVQALGGNGWLAYSTAEVLDRQKSLDALNKVQAAAKAQGRPLTADELRSAVGANGDLPAPAIIDHPQKINLTKASIAGNRADVEFDDGGITYSATVVKTPNGWRIAGEKIVNYHV